jgi:nitrite reductase (NADH) small subunit
MNWVDIAALDDIPPLGARLLTTPSGNIAVFRTTENEVYALEDRCPHKGGPLSQGIVFDKRVACPLHDWVIDLEQGCAQEPDEGCIKTFPVRIDNGRVFISLGNGTTRPVTKVSAQA